MLDRRKSPFASIYPQTGRGIVMSAFYNQIVCFGDSITQKAWVPEELGWGAALQNAYARKLDVIGRGFSGYTTEHAKILLPQIIPKSVPENGSKVILITLFFGANDATIEGTRQHVPLDVYASNLREILTSPILKHHNPDIKLLLITPPPICAYRWGDHDREAGREPQRTAEHTALYASRAKQVALELGVPHVDLWTGFLEAAGWKEGEPLIGSTTVPKNDKLGQLMPDGLHFSSEGNKLCYELVLRKIKEFYPELDPEKMEANVPMWDMARDILAELKGKFGIS